MAEPLRLRATSASAGIAAGTAYVAEEPAASPATAVHADSGYPLLSAAIETAVEELHRLAQGVDADSQDIIDFQIEVLRDPTMAEATRERIDAGENVVFAWVGTLDGYVNELEQAEEEEMRARAVDILDVKHRVLAALTGKAAADFPRGSVYVGDNMEPSRFLAHDWSAGGAIALFGGSVAGHVAMLARARSVPMVVRAGRFMVAEGDHVRVDGDAGTVVVGNGRQSSHPAPLSAPVLTRGRNGPAPEVERTADGVPIRLSINVNDPAELETLDPATIAGVGLMRSEFAVRSAADAANEEKQLGIYRRVLEWAGDRPVTIRMLDIGGDKPLPGLDDMPPSLPGDLRGIRLLLARPEIARVQARALLRAAPCGRLNVMLPMVSFPSEVDAMRRIFEEEAAQLAHRRQPHLMPPIGMMVEVPAAALMLDTFETSDFFSFGTNDLIHYLSATARDGSGLEADGDNATPAVLRLIGQASKLAGHKPTSICGDMAGDPRCLPALLAAGLRHFSVAPTRLPAIRSALIGLNADGTKAAGE
ncbi:putative PEP-binding protein [Rhizobium sp. RAF56]|uniref:putative PEP-binding protein n=1 Tax=Rhizobium sp. RAF56 TaxID=3233062 RepID=UPI003F9B55C5